MGFAPLNPSYGLRDIAKAWLQADARALAQAISNGVLEEVEYGEEKA